jgi:hypothetical protein
LSGHIKQVLDGNGQARQRLGLDVRGTGNGAGLVKCGLQEGMLASGRLRGLNGSLNFASAAVWCGGLKAWNRRL